MRKLQAAEALDPVPPPADMKRKMAAAELEMLVRSCQYRVTSLIRSSDPLGPYV